MVRWIASEEHVITIHVVSEYFQMILMTDCALLFVISR